MDMEFAYDDLDLPSRRAPQRANGHDQAGAGGWPVGLQQSGAEADDEIGDILMRVQQFATDSAEEARSSARATIDAAQAEAANIMNQAHRSAAGHAQSLIDSARAEADGIIQAARQEATATGVAGVSQLRRADSTVPTVSTGAISSLAESISEFADTNRELIEELRRLQAAIGQSAQRPDTSEGLRVQTPPLPEPEATVPDQPTRASGTWTELHVHDDPNS